MGAQGSEYLYLSYRDDATIKSLLTWLNAHESAMCNDYALAVWRAVQTLDALRQGSQWIDVDARGMRNPAVKHR